MKENTRLVDKYFCIYLILIYTKIIKTTKNVVKEAENCESSTCGLKRFQISGALLMLEFC